MATSHAEPCRPRGMGVASRSGFIMLASRPKFVSIRPGITMLTRIFFGPTSFAAACANPSSAALFGICDGVCSGALRSVGSG